MKERERIMEVWDRSKKKNVRREGRRVKEGNQPLSVLYTYTYIQILDTSIVSVYSR